MAEVTKLRQPEVNKVIATGLNVVIGLSNDRQISFQSGYEGDEDDSSINARLDRMMRFADRLKAKYEIPEIEDELFKHRDALANFLEDRTRVEQNHARDQAARQVQIDEMEALRSKAREEKLALMNAEILRMQEMRAEHWNAGAERHRASGRQGTYKPRGAEEATIGRIDLGLKHAAEARDVEMAGFDTGYDAMIEKVRAEMSRANAEKDQALANLGISVKRYEDAITEREERLAKRRAVAEG